MKQSPDPAPPFANSCAAGCMLVRNVYYTYMTTTPTIENNNPDRGRTPAPGPHNNPNEGTQK